MAVAAIFWAVAHAVMVEKVEMTHEIIKVNTELNEDDPETADLPRTSEAALAEMIKINKYIKEGAITFLKKEYLYLSVFCLIFGIVLLCTVDQPWNATAHVEESNENVSSVPYTTIAFWVGAFTSMAAGYIGMMIATSANVKTTYGCNDSMEEGFKHAFRGGQVLGFALVGLALLILEIIILSYKPGVLGSDYTKQLTLFQWTNLVRELFEFVSGYGLGGSTVALFGRVGGGIYTKAADVGADLAGKVGEKLPEDSPLNPGTIADNVGDNVGDIAGMGADLFGSLAESTCAALVVSCSSAELIYNHPDAAYFPMIITAVGIGASFITTFFAYIEAGTVETKLKLQLIISTVLMSALIIPTLSVLPENFTIVFANTEYYPTQWKVYGCIMLGLWSGLLIGLATEYYTSHSYGPTRELARACTYDAATNVIKGLALGYMSTIIPILCLAVTILFAFKWAAMYGVALSAIGMLGCLPIALTIDGYGPISDNAGGIAEMCNLDDSIREKTDALDAAGNTTAAVGKGFAIGSAALVALALFGAFVTRVEADLSAELGVATVVDATTVNILEPLTFAGLLIGAMLPYAFSALTMSAVGDAAEAMIAEIRRQVPLIKAGAAPDHETCISISTNSSLKYMIAPGAIVILAPFIGGILFSYKFVSGLLAGNIVSGIQIAFSFSNTGGAWDNAKKYVEAG